MLSMNFPVVKFMLQRWTILGAVLGVLLVPPAAKGQDQQPSAFPRESLSTKELAIEPGVAEGIAVLAPARMKAAEIGDYTLHFDVGQGGVPVGGRVRVAFPKAWFTNPYPLWKIVQQEDVAKPHHLSVSCSNSAAALTLTVTKVNFWGKKERFTRMVTIGVTNSPLSQGDRITVSLANTTAPYLAGPDEVLVAVDALGDGGFRMIKSGAPYRVLPEEAIEVSLVAPSQAVIGLPVQLQVTGFDKFYNLSPPEAKSIAFTGIDAKPVRRKDLGKPGAFVFEYTPQKSGFIWPGVRVVRSGGKPVLQAAGNPIRVFAAAPAEKIYWGELHSHSPISKDGSGKGDFDYARNIARLDFFAASEHAEGDSQTRGISTAEWEEIKTNTDGYNEPGKFATLLGYEINLATTSGHHNVLFRSLDGSPWPGYKVLDIEALWGKIKAGKAITIPHHLAVIWGGQPEEAPAEPGLQEILPAPKSATSGPFVDWGPQNNRKRPLLEIYSLHGSSEQYQPEDPLSYENVRFNSARSANEPHYARDAWKLGQRVGVIGGSDNHHAQPGSGGLAAVVAPELSRENVFDALAARHTYATTGSRIYLDFRVAGVGMGDAGKRSGGITGKVLLAAPTKLAYAEVIRLNLTSGEYGTVARWEKATKFLKEKFTDSVSGDSHMYYLRAELAEKVRGRTVRVWSSPIWIDP